MKRKRLEKEKEKRRQRSGKKKQKFENVPYSEDWAWFLAVICFEAFEKF